MKLTNISSFQQVNISTPNVCLGVTNGSFLLLKWLFSLAKWHLAPVKWHFCNAKDCYLLPTRNAHFESFVSTLLPKKQQTVNPLPKNTEFIISSLNTERFFSEHGSNGNIKQQLTALISNYYSELFKPLYTTSFRLRYRYRFFVSKCQRTL